MNYVDSWAREKSASVFLGGGSEILNWGAGARKRPLEHSTQPSKVRRVNPAIPIQVQNAVTEVKPAWYTRFQEAIHYLFCRAGNCAPYDAFAIPLAELWN